MASKVNLDCDFLISQSNFIEDRLDYTKVINK